MAVTYDSGAITLDKPPANSYDIDYMRELAAAIEAADADAAVRVVVVRSASEKFFCAGADIKAFAANEVDANMEMIRLAHAALASMARSPKLFVACVAGHALGGGLEIALACDVRYAIEGRYRLGTPEVTLGILPGNGGTQRLPRLIGAGPALELLVTGRTVSPEEAQGLGIISKVFADQAAFDAHIDGLRALPLLSFANIKRAVFEGSEKPLPDALALECDLIEELFGTNDAHEGVTAFSEKRTPEFTGS
ncbi:MAG TPA: enoyl-CoA hydratase-related protein [Solirubrobacteraceae bacterium]|nr:enoyl-CoA hydratase-related protein [Solirubrobacteraceae bacterium]